MLEVIETTNVSAKNIMKKDESLLEQLDQHLHPILHLYKWRKPSFTYGYFIPIEKHLDLKSVEKHGLEFSRRPTGGGIVFHIWDYAFSFLMPSTCTFFSLNTLENYRFVNRVILKVMNEFLEKKDLELTLTNALVENLEACNFCMARATKYDVIHDGRKIAGAAQRKTKKGFLHQGTISLAPPQKDLLRDVLISRDKMYQAIAQSSFVPLQEKYSEKDLEQARIQVKQLLIKHFQKALKNE